MCEDIGDLLGKSSVGYVAGKGTLFLYSNKSCRGKETMKDGRG
jgi:hypothetical protein